MSVASINSPSCPFSAAEAIKSSDEWGCNCGPGALAAILGKTLDEVRPLIPGFEQKRYTNPTMMYEALNASKTAWRIDRGLAATRFFPKYGLARVQWEGPWTEPGVPARARYRYTHWIGSHVTADRISIFDINAIAYGGWIHADEWTNDLVPWLLKELYPRANGKWHLTHVIEISREDA
jgi:hypothetical protein